MMNLRTLLVVVFVMGPAVPGWAAKKEPKPSVADKPTAKASSPKEEKERAAKRACLNRDPDKGVELLTDLYVDTNEPVYIFNQGRCYEQNDRCEDAIVRFREYLRKTPAAADADRADAQKHIEDCEALLARRASEAAVTPPSQPAAAPAEPVPSVGEQQPPAQVITPAQVVGTEVAPTPAGAGLRTAGVVTMAGGAAVLIGAVVLNLKHNGMIRDLKDDYVGDTADSAKTYKTLASVGYGVGAVCLVGGAALYWLGFRAGSAQVGPTLVGGNAGLMMSGGF